MRDNVIRAANIGVTTLVWFRNLANDYKLRDIMRSTAFNVAFTREARVGMFNQGCPKRARFPTLETA